MSIRLEYTLDWDPAQGEPLSPFALGDLTVSGGLGVASTCGQSPDQSCMVFISLALLLDGLRKFLASADAEYEFGAADSSFSLRFTKLHDRRIRITSANGVLDVVSDRELARAVYDCAASAGTVAFRNLAANDAVRRTIEGALCDFEEKVVRNNGR